MVKVSEKNQCWKNFARTSLSALFSGRPIVKSPSRASISPSVVLPSRLSSIVFYSSTSSGFFFRRWFFQRSGPFIPPCLSEYPCPTHLACLLLIVALFAIYSTLLHLIPYHAANSLHLPTDPRFKCPQESFLLFPQDPRFSCKERYTPNKTFNQDFPLWLHQASSKQLLVFIKCSLVQCNYVLSSVTANDAK